MGHAVVIKYYRDGFELDKKKKTYEEDKKVINEYAQIAENYSRANAHKKMPMRFGACRQPSSIAVGDLNNDDQIDMTFGCLVDDVISVVLHRP